MHQGLVQRLPIVWRGGRELFPGLCQRVFEESLVRRIVEYQQAASDRHVLDQVVQLMNAAGIGGGEAAQVHQDRLAILDQARQCRLPAVGVAEEVVDAETAIRITRMVALGEAACERGLIADEMPVKLAAEEVKELMWLDGAERNIGSGDHLDTADVPPMLGHAVEQRVTAATERKHAQEGEVAGHARV